MSFRERGLRNEKKFTWLSPFLQQRSLYNYATRILLTNDLVHEETTDSWQLFVM